MPSIPVEEWELRDLFEAFDVFGRIEDGRLGESLEEEPALARRCSLGGESYYMWIDDQVCGFQARIHYIRGVFGHVAGRWPSAIKIGDATIHRQGHQRRSDV